MSSVHSLPVPGSRAPRGPPSRFWMEQAPSPPKSARHSGRASGSQEQALGLTLDPCPTPTPRTSHTESRGFQKCSLPVFRNAGQPCCLHTGCSQDQSELGRLLSSLWKHLPYSGGSTGEPRAASTGLPVPPPSTSQRASVSTPGLPKPTRGLQSHTRCQSSLFLKAPPQGQENPDAAHRSPGLSLTVHLHPTSRPHHVHLYNGSTQAVPHSTGRD